MAEHMDAAAWVLFLAILAFVYWIGFDNGRDVSYWDYWHQRKASERIDAEGTTS